MRAFDARELRGRRILLLIPHPDDEVVGCAAAIRRAIAAGAEFIGLYLTTGVPEKAALWRHQRRRYDEFVQTRRAEALAAAQELGLRPWRFLDFASRTLTRNLLAADAVIRAALAAERIDAIWTAAWEGAHQDHDATNALAARHAGTGPVLEFAEYNCAEGRTSSQRFAQPNGSELGLELGDEERRLKRHLLSIYRSERANLRHIAVTRECLRPLPVHDYSQPPHPGPLFYERFHWWPFGHPRIDRSRSAEVRALLVQNLRRLAERDASPTP